MGRAIVNRRWEPNKNVGYDNIDVIEFMQGKHRMPKPNRIVGFYEISVIESKKNAPSKWHNNTGLDAISVIEFMQDKHRVPKPNKLCRINYGKNFGVENYDTVANCIPVNPNPNPNKSIGFNDITVIQNKKNSGQPKPQKSLFLDASVIESKRQKGLVNKRKDTGEDVWKTGIPVEAQYFKLMGSILGIVAGAWYAFTKKSGFVGYLGYILLFHLIGVGLGAATDITIKKINSPQ